MAKRLSQIKKEFFLSKGIGTAQTPVDQQEMVYNKSQATSTGSLKNSRIQYLRNLITAHGGTPSGKYESDLVKQAVRALGFTAQKNTSANWRIIYTNA